MVTLLPKKRPTPMSPPIAIMLNWRWVSLRLSSWPSWGALKESLIGIHLVGLERSRHAVRDLEELPQTGESRLSCCSEPVTRGLRRDRCSTQAGASCAASTCARHEFLFLS